MIAVLTQGKLNRLNELAQKKKLGTLTDNEIQGATRFSISARQARKESIH